MASTGEFDIGPLTWVKGEIDQALTRAVAALRASVAHPDDLTQIHHCQTHFHQVHGALQIVGLDGVAKFSEEIEGLLADVGDGTAQPTAPDVAERCIGAISTYLDQLLAGQPNQPLKLFSVYREVVVERGRPAPHPTDLYFPGPAHRRERSTRGPIHGVDRSQTLRTERSRFMRGFLRWLRKDRDGMREMQLAVAGINTAESDSAAREYWSAASTLLDGISSGAMPDEAGVPRLCNRIERQIKRLIDGAPGVAERLLREVLYHTACAEPITEGLRTAQENYGLIGTVPISFDLQANDSSLLPRLRGMREAVLAAKSAWMKYTAGHIHSIEPFTEQVTHMRDRSEPLGRLELTRLIDELLVLANRLAPSLSAPSESMSLEVATALLFTEDAIERFSTLPSEFALQCKAMTARLRNAREDGPAQFVPASQLLDEISRQAQERIAIAQLMGEIQTNLREIEAGLDAYFRDQGRRTELPRLERPISQIIGAFRILNDDQAARALTECARRIRDFAGATYVPTEIEFDNLAATLSGLGFYVSGLQHGKADFNAAMRPIPPVRRAEPAPSESTTVEVQLEQQIRDTQNLVEAWHASPDDPSRKEDLRQHVESLQHDASLTADSNLEMRAQEALSLLSKHDVMPVQSDIAEALAGLTPIDVGTTEPSAEVQRLADAPREVIDAELLDVYIEEAGEVIETIDEYLELARIQPAVIEHLRTIRRGFHTLKGSGRMVGLTSISEAAWAVEKVMNACLEDERPANSAVFELVADGRDLFAAAVAALKGNKPLPDEAPIIAKAAAIDAGDTAVVIGRRRLTPGLFQIFLGEAHAHIDALHAMQGSIEAGHPVTEEDLRPAHTLAGVCGSVGFGAIRDVASALEVALEGLKGSAVDATMRATIGEAIASLDQMVQAVAARDEPGATPELVLRLQQFRDELGVAASAPHSIYRDDPIDIIEQGSEEDLPETTDEGLGDFSQPVPATSLDFADSPDDATADHDDFPLQVWDANQFEALSAPPDEDMPVVSGEQPVEIPRLFERVAESPDDSPRVFAPIPPASPIRLADVLVRDDVDAEVFELFAAEAQELLPAIAGSIRAWRAAPEHADIGHQLQRLLHTLKGSGRMAGAMHMGELLHDMENRVENAVLLSPLPLSFFDDLEVQYDAVGALFERLQGGDPVISPAVQARLHAVPTVVRDMVDAPFGAESGDSDQQRLADADAPPDDPFVQFESTEGQAIAPAIAAEPERVALLRVRADAIDRLVNQAGEVAIARSRIEGEVKGLKATLSELTENISRLRSQLREIEIQAETQIQSKMVQSSEKDRQFDPLEFDRYTRFQELTRMMAESVSDVAAVHQSITRSLDETDAALLAQSRLSRELQQDLLRVRMVPFKNLSERLYRIVRQAAKDAGKRATLDIRGSQVEIDRSVLERITAPFEHMLRNAIAHGIESPTTRIAAGKMEVGEIRIEIRQEGNEVMMAVADDGGGIDLDRIRTKAIERGLVKADGQVTEAELTDLIFLPGFTTATEITQLAGRGIGMDVVKSEIVALGGRVEVTTDRGKGARFIVFLPLTLAVTQAIVIQAGAAKYAIPGLLIEQVRKVRADELAEAYRTGVAVWQNRRAPFHYLPRLLGDNQSPPEAKRLAWVIFVRSGSALVAVQVDEIIGNQEIVVKNTGPLLARVTGITGATVLGSGEIVLILNPVVVAVKELAVDADAPLVPVAVHQPAALAMDPIVMIVDDSLTVRKITGRLLSRAGYHVVTARDGVDAIEQLDELVPDVMVIDIEMPRMDGFDLTRHIRARATLKHLPIVMVTSRTADKHRTFAMEIGVNAFLGKPYRDEELLNTVAGYLSDKARSLHAAYLVAAKQAH
ncbi:MAG: Hpt domain-containing protein [Burkholderiales bacterium]